MDKEFLSKNKKRLLSLFSIPFVAATVVAVSNADTYATDLTYQQQLEQGTLRHRQIEQELNEHREQMAPIHAQIYELGQTILETQRNFDTVIDNLELIRYELERTQENLEEARKIREEQQQRLISRVRAMYMNGPTTYLDVILNSADFTDMLVRMEFINIIIEHDQNLVFDLLETEAFIEETYEEIALQEVRYSALQVQYANSLNRYMAQQEDFESLLSQLEEEEQEIVRGLQDQARANEEFENLIRRQSRVARATAGPSNNAVIVDTSNLNGQMAWPVPGQNQISSPFGPRRSPISGRQEHHTGIDIRSPQGRNIIAADAGVVTFSGYQNGFGNTVIIDHGDGISTLYAHNTQNLVTRGQGVVAGQVIATIGSTGWSTGNHLHFEVRYNGSPVNPMNFLGR